MIWGLLAIAFNSFAWNPSASSFKDIVQKIESFHKTDLISAIKLAEFHEKNINNFTLQERIRFKKIQAQLYSDQTNYKLSEKVANEGLDLTKKLSHPSIMMAELLNFRGFAIERRGDYDEALKDYVAALEIAESLDDRRVVIQALANLGAIYYILEEYERSLIVLNDALSQAQILKDDRMFGLVYLELSTLYNYINHKGKAQFFSEQALAAYTRVNDPYNILISQKNLSADYAANKQYLKAIDLYEQVILEAKSVGNLSEISHTYSKMAEAYLKNKPSDPYKAFDYILLAEKYLKHVEEVGYEILLMVNKAKVLTELERFQEANELIEKAELILDKQPVNIGNYSKLEILQIKSKLYFAQSRYKEAYQAQVEHHQAIHDRSSQIDVEAIEDLRIQYETKQEDLKAKELEKKKFLQSLSLSEVKESQQNRNFYILIGLVTVIGLAWFYSINLNHQKKLLDSRETDHLTDLPNRQTILSIGASEFNKAKSHKNGYSVLIIKLDNFTNINHVKGYDIGNSILIEVSLIITKIISDIGQCGRYSSNEFIVLLPNCNAQIATDIANKIHSDIYKKPWDRYGLKVVSVSIGMANDQTDHVESYEAIIKSAGMLKQHAVFSGGNTVCV